jgi:hypothetical protein
VLLRQVDRWIGLTKSLAERLPDKRDPDKIEHSLESMLRQCICGLALGYEDLNDPNTVRLHSGIGYVTPQDKLLGRDKAILQARDEKLQQARERHRQKRAAQALAPR